MEAASERVASHSGVGKFRAWFVGLTCKTQRKRGANRITAARMMITYTLVNKLPLVPRVLGIVLKSGRGGGGSANKLWTSEAFKRSPVVCNFVKSFKWKRSIGFSFRMGGLWKHHY